LEFDIPIKVSFEILDLMLFNFFNLLCGASVLVWTSTAKVPSYFVLFEQQGFAVVSYELFTKLEITD
jgi:hypothetical protein